MEPSEKRSLDTTAACGPCHAALSADHPATSETAAALRLGTSKMRLDIVMPFDPHSPIPINFLK
jgi:hypothetical protein